MQQKIVVIIDDELTEVNNLLNKGWKVSNMTACGVPWISTGKPICYVYLTKE